MVNSVRVCLSAVKLPLIRITSGLSPRVSKRASSIRSLQGLTDCLLSGEDTPLKNIWDEICVQVQYEESFLWEDVYLEMIRSSVLYEVRKLEEEVRQAIWFQTDEGIYWDEDEEEQDEIYFDDDKITDYILRDYLLRIASDWTNRRIDKFQNRGHD